MVNGRILACISVAAIGIAACGNEAAGTNPAPMESTATAVATASISRTTDPGCVVGASWADQSGYAGLDEPALQKALVAAGATYLSTDAKSSAATQASDIADLISRGAKVLIVVAQDGIAIEPFVASATQGGIPVIAYDRLIENATLYLSFDNVEVGRMQARALLKAVPKGNYVFIKGDERDANSDFLRVGQEEILGDPIKEGDVTNVGEMYADNWDPDVAAAAMEGFLAANGNKVDAVLSENDGLAGGVIAALTAHGLVGETAVSGQDGEVRALNRVALGSQTVDVWKDRRLLGKAAGDAAVQLCAGVPADQIFGVAAFKTPTGSSISSVLFKPIPITRDNLNLVVEAGWVTKDALCLGVAIGSVKACP